MTQQFREGQEVEVAMIDNSRDRNRIWLKAKVIGPEWTNGQSRHMWIVEIDGEHLLFDVEHIRPIVPPINEGENWKGPPLMLDRHGRSN
jgi:hypothetical protein